MPSEEEYWRRRRDELARQLVNDETELNRRLAELYEGESVWLEREIAAYYQRYGENNVIEYRRLLAALSDEDHRMLMERMDEFAEQYPQYAHLLPVRASIYRLNELEGIQASIRLQQLRIGAIEQTELEAHFERQAQRAANLAAEEMGFGESFYRVNDPVIRETVGAAWANGKRFSDSIWDNRERLAAYLNDDFAKALARGVAYEEMARTLRGRFEHVSRRDSMRLIYTEGTFLLNEAQAKVHESDFDHYRLSCVNDKRACRVCLGLQAEQRERPARFDERAPGVNFPPLHPWCRCSYEVEVADWDVWMDRYVASRGGDAVTRRQEAEGTERRRRVGMPGMPMARRFTGDFTSEEYEDYRRELQAVQSRERIWLPKDEYAHVMGELNTHMSDEDRKHALVRKAIGDYYYTVVNYGFDNYKIIRRDPIE